MCKISFHADCAQDAFHRSDPNPVQCVEMVANYTVEEMEDVCFSIATCDDLVSAGKNNLLCYWCTRLVAHADSVRLQLISGEPEPAED